MQRNPNFRVNIYSREHAFAEVPKTWQTEEFVKSKASPTLSSFVAFMPKPDSVRPMQRHISNAERALGGWIKALDRSARRRSSYKEANENFLWTNKFKLNHSNDDIRTQPVVPRQNLHLLRDGLLQDEEFHNHTAARRTPCFPVNAIDQPIGKFMLKERFERTDSDEAEFRRQNTHPPAELVRVHRGGSFDKEAEFSKAYRQWVKILTRKPDAGLKPSSRRRRAANHARESTYSEFEPLPDLSMGYEPLAGGGGCCCKTKLIPPRNQISPPAGALHSVTNYHDQFGEKFGPKTNLILPTDKLSPPHGQILSNTSYAQDFLDKPYSRRDLIILPGRISPLRGVVSSSTQYTEHFLDQGYSKREKIVPPGRISPPQGHFSSETNYAQDYQECNYCRRGYIVPPGGISPPQGHMRSDTVYEEQYGDKGHCQRAPIRLPDAISPPSGIVQEGTTYNHTFQDCGQCPQHPYGQSEKNLVQELGPVPAPIDDKIIDFYPDSPTDFSHKTQFQPEAQPFEADQSPQPITSEDVATSVMDTENFWDAEQLADDISRLHFCKSIQKRLFESDCKAKDQHCVRREKRKKRVKVVQRTEAQLASPGYIKVPPPLSPKPPTAIKQKFASSYSKSYVAESMRNLH